MFKFEGRGYKVISSSSNKRYKHVYLEKNRKKYFLKIAKKNNLNLKNEIYFNNEVNKMKNKPFLCPQVIENGNNYALFQYFSRPVKKDFRLFIPKIVETLLWLPKQKFSLPIDKEKKFNHEIAYKKQKILDLASGYAAKTDQNFPELLDIIKKTSFKKQVLNHCEIKPEHLYDVNGKLGIIDSEWASMKTPEHYDFSSCYARTFIINPSWARDLYLLYKRRCKDDLLDNKIKGILAWRTIGEYSDAFKRNEITVNHKKLTNKVINGDFGK